MVTARSEILLEIRKFAFKRKILLGKLLLLPLLHLI